MGPSIPAPVRYPCVVNDATYGTFDLTSLAEVGDWRAVSERRRARAREREEGKGGRTDGEDIKSEFNQECRGNMPIYLHLL